MQIIRTYRPQYSAIEPLPSHEELERQNREFLFGEGEPGTAPKTLGSHLFHSEADGWHIVLFTNEEDGAPVVTLEEIAAAAASQGYTLSDAVELLGEASHLLWYAKADPELRECI